MSTWYEDAVIYELHVRAFADSDGDGIGDFVGLHAAARLPPGPRRHRDLAAAVLPVTDARRRLRHLRLPGHQPGLRHACGSSGASSTRRTSAGCRSSPSSCSTTPRISIRGSSGRGGRRPAAGTATGTCGATTPDRYRDARDHLPRLRAVELDVGPRGRASTTGTASTRIQPDLNFDNPEVRREMLRTVEYWLDLGVDGLRLDAVPYLFERDGTSCENLPETHEFLKELRRARRRALRRPHAARGGEPVARGRESRTSATATSATWRSTSR